MVALGVNGSAYYITCNELICSDNIKTFNTDGRIYFTDGSERQWSIGRNSSSNWTLRNETLNIDSIIANYDTGDVSIQGGGGGGVSTLEALTDVSITPADKVGGSFLFYDNLSNNYTLSDDIFVIDASNNSIKLGVLAGNSNQGVDSVAIGNEAGYLNQGIESIAFGHDAGYSNQGRESIAIGHLAGKTSQGIKSVAIGLGAGFSIQGNNSVALGYDAGTSNQADNSVAVGYFAGFINQGTESISIGYTAGFSSQGASSVAIGTAAGSTSQSSSCIAIGNYAGETGQNQESISIGHYSGNSNQGIFSVAIGNESGKSNQGSNSVAIGYGSGTFIQGNSSVSLGYNAGFCNQGNYTLAIGTSAAYVSQGIYSVALGSAAGFLSQGSESIAIGHLAGSDTQASDCIAIGHESAVTSQGSNSIAIGRESGRSNQGSDSLAIGHYAGFCNQGDSALSIGFGAGYDIQGSYSIAIGNQSGKSNQGSNSLAFGHFAGFSDQSNNALAIGVGAGYDSQGSESVAIGHSAGQTNQGVDSIAIGYESAITSQGSISIAIGRESGKSNQGSESLALGHYAGFCNQGNFALSIGVGAGYDIQGNNSVAIGYAAGQTNQGSNSIAIGYDAGNNTQASDSIAIGHESALNSQGSNSIAIGNKSGKSNQGSNSLAFGHFAGSDTQASDCIAIGHLAGFISQGTSSIAIGHFAGFQDQSANSICLNATGSFINPTNSGVFIAPIRNTELHNINTITNPLTYNLTSSEITNSGFIFIDNSNNRVGFGVPYPEEDFELDGNIQLDTGGVQRGRIIFYDKQNDHEHAEIDGLGEGDNGGVLAFYTKIDGVSGSGSVTEKLRINNKGAIGIGGANYGESGQVLVSDGSGNPVNWADQTDTTYTAGTGVSIVGNQISIGQSVDTSSNVLFGNYTKIGDIPTDRKFATFAHKDYFSDASAALIQDNGGNTFLMSGSFIETRIAGANKMIIDGNGVGIGGIYPSQTLDVNGTIKMRGATFYGGGNTIDIYPVTNSTDSLSWVEMRTDRLVLGGPKMEFFTNSTNNSTGATSMYILENGNVGIATNNPSERLEITGNIRFNNADNNSIRFGNGGGFRGQPKISAYVPFPNSNYGPDQAKNELNFGFHTPGSIQWEKLLTVGGDWIYHYLPFQYTSDDRLKHNEKDIVNGLDIIRLLQPQKYQKSMEMYDEDYNGEIDGMWRWEAGLIAQEVLQIPDLSFCVAGGDKIGPSGERIEEPYFLDYNSILIYGIAATKELDKKVKEQQEIINKQQETIDSLILRLEALEKNN